MATFRGIAFPFGKSQTSFPASSEDEELVKQNLVQIIATTKGERVMRHDVGSNAMSYVFENNDDVLVELIKEELSAAIAQFEPRAIVRDIQTERSDNEVTITIIYIVALTGRQDTVAVTTPVA